LSKKLKKKIEEICGLKDLAWEARQDRAKQILASSDWKQSICNELLGLSFRELEKTLSSVASERQKKEDSYQEKLDLYNKGKISREPSKPTRGDSVVSKSNKTAARPPPRTLQEILSQVYAPRMVQDLSLEERAYLYALRSTESSDEVPPDSSDGNDRPQE